MQSNVHVALLRVSLSASLLFFAIPAGAQLVEVRPGYVRAPFVEVFGHPDGSAHVHAPFVSVHARPGYRPLPPPLPFFSHPLGVGRFAVEVRSEPVQVRPARVQVTRPTRVRNSVPNLDGLDWSALRDVAQGGVAQLARSLARDAAAAEWRNYLHLAELSDVLAGMAGPPTETERTLLIELLRNYDATLQSRSMQHITSLPGFHTVHRALGKLLQLAPPVAPPEQALSLEAAASQLHDELQQRNADRWIDYLRVRSLMGRAVTAGLPQPPGAASYDEIGDLVERYERVEQEPRYRKIADLPGFQHVLSRLREVQYGTAASDTNVEKLPAPSL